MIYRFFSFGDDHGKSEVRQRKFFVIKIITDSPEGQIK